MQGTTAGTTPRAEGVFKRRRPAAVDLAAVVPDVGAWTAPQWAAPEAAATPHLALLRDLPAQPPAAGRVSSLFGPRRPPHGTDSGRRPFHAGIDIAVPVGTPVVAPGPGTVVGVGHGRRLGRYVLIRHEAVGLETLLAHLSSVAPGLRRGTPVRRGQMVGHSGNSGRSTGPHLHVEMRTTDANGPVDPLRIYALYTRALDRLAAFPIASVHAQLPPYRIEGPLPTGPPERPGPSRRS
jgi:murein DD-endopeptidase MepM/ murein hydrolase activator NlpD